MKAENSGLGAGKRDDLENLTWKAVQAAVDYSKREENSQRKLRSAGKQKPTPTTKQAYRNLTRQ